MADTPDTRLIHHIQAKNLLSFGPDFKGIELGPLNILIGPNGTGKSNLIQVLDLLHHVPRKIQDPIARAGGIGEWLWNGNEESRATLAFKIIGLFHKALGYRFSISQQNQRLKFGGETLIRFPNLVSLKGHRIYWTSREKSFTRLPDASERIIDKELFDVDLNRSILTQRIDPVNYPEFTLLATAFERIKIYNDWSFGPKSPIRRPCTMDMPNDILEPDLSNLPLVLNHLRDHPPTKKVILKYLQAIYEGIEDFGVRLANGTAVVTIQEGDRNISGFRLSDGTLRYLCLLAILCHPKPPPLICIEEPELGLHPDLISVVAELLKEASKRTQIIVTTHSDLLVDAMTDMPEAIIVCEKGEQGTTMKRLDPEEMAPWLEQFRLGNLWTSGDIGGTRW